MVAPLGESVLKWTLATEEALAALAACVAQRWREDGPDATVVGLRGGLGAGKTTWVRATLRGLGHGGPVPSPTYTLIETYACGELEVIHLDLYRIAIDDELEALGMREWAGRSGCWVFVEWPQRSPSLSAACDLFLDFDMTPNGGRTLSVDARTARGESLLRHFHECRSSN
jgi:tRNA threonylcarbamoyladenosine biosynthesis protein TsaE